MTLNTLFETAESLASQQLLGVAIASTLLCLVAWLISKISQTRDAASRFWVWQTVGNGVLLSTVLLFLTAGIPLRSGDEATAATSISVATTTSVAPATTTSAQPRVPFTGLDKEIAPFASTPVQTPVNGVNQSSSYESNGSPIAAHPHPTIVAPEPPEQVKSGSAFPIIPTLLLTLVSLWVVGFAWKLLEFIIGIMRCYRIVSQAKPVESTELNDFLARISEDTKARQNVRLLSSDSVDVPFAIGIWSPRIVIPSALLNWPNQKLEMVVSHELAHIHRSDILWHWLNRLACCLAWFNPLIWFAAKRGILERERACDDRVLQTGALPTEYGQSLVDVAAMMVSHKNMACTVSMAEPPLKERLRFILTSERKSKSSSLGFQCLIIALFMMMALGTGLFRPLAVAKAPAPLSSSPPDLQPKSLVDEQDRKLNSPNEKSESSLPGFNGKVLTHDGQPAVGVSVDLQLYAWVNDPESGRKLDTLGEWTVQTDANGKYSIDTGHLKEVPKGAVIAIDRVYHPSIVEGRRGGWKAFSVENNGTLPDYQLVKGRQIKGQILNSNKQPIKAIVKSCGGTQDPNKAWFPQGIETQNDGSFQLMAPVDYQIELLVIADGHLPHRIAVPGNLPEQLLHYDGGPISVEDIKKLDESGIPEDDTDENAPYDAGQVVLTAGNPIQGKVVDGSGSPVSGVLVALKTANSSNLDAIAFGVQFATYSDKAGRFSLPPGVGKSHVVVTDRAYVSDRIRNREIKGPKAPPVNPISLDLDESSQFDDVVLTAITGTVRVSGLVKFDNGEPAQGVEVVGGCSPGTEFSKVLTDENGNYSMEMPSPLDNAFVRVYGAKDERGVWHTAVQQLDNGSGGGQYSQLFKLEQNVDGLNWTLRELKSYGFEESVEYTKARKEFRKLEQLRQQILETFVSEEKKAETPEEKERIYMELDPRNAMAKHYLAFEEKHRGTQGAFLAIKAGMGAAVSVGNPQTNASKCRNEMVSRLLEHYLDHKDLGTTFEQLGGGPLVTERDKILDMARKHSPHRKVRGQAILYKVEFLLEDIRLAEQLPRARDVMEKKLASMPKQMADTYRSYIAQLEKINKEASRGKALLWLDIMEQEYGDVRVDFPSSYYGQKLGVISKQLRYVLTYVKTGFPAPEIEGKDTQGKPFKLSELKGKPVILIFTHKIFPGDIYGQELATQFENEDVEFLTIVGASKVDEFREKTNLENLQGIVMLEPLSWAGDGYRAKWFINTQTIYAINKEGILVGEIEEEAIEKWLAEQSAK